MDRIDDDPNCSDTHDGEQCELPLGHAGDHMSHNDDWPATVRGAARTASGQQPETTVCACPHPVDEHSVYGCADNCACEWMPRRPAVGQPAEAQAAEAPLTAAERKFLHFALDLAFDALVSGAGFTNEDDAACAKLRRMAGKDER